MKRRLRLEVAGQALGETAPVLYDGSALTLRLEVAGDTVSATIIEDGEAAEPLVATMEAPPAGALSLEVRAIPSPWMGEGQGGGAPVAATFDDFAWLEVSGGAEVRDYTYNAINQLLEITGAENSTFTYNDLGQLTRQERLAGTGGPLGATDYGYDRLGRQTSVSTATSYSAYEYYGATWMRKSAYTPEGLTNYVYDGFACVSQTTNGIRTDYAVPGSTPVWETTGGQALTHALDGRGNVTGLWGALPNAGGALGYVTKFQYDAFGNLKTLLADPASGDPAHPAYISAPNTSGPRWQGQLFDAATDQVYLRNRYYAPGTGRFNAPDPIGYSGGANLYGYCGSDPVNQTDWMGQLVKYKGEVVDSTDWNRISA
ncbi:MAG: RHS repeat-associated core domain-containing protein, partial [Kiritimatiellota bacterium]|nr:RHS repeat-associated core domain-containing protein [Kiritimatiellota bacterium]